MKHNYGSSVYHIFFHKPEGLDYASNYSNGNMSWRDNILYSYSSELGWADFDKKIIWVRRGSRSSTTSRHQWSLISAIPSDWTIVYISNWNDWERYSLAPRYEPELKHIIQLCKENKEKLYSGNKYFGNIDYVIAQINSVKETLQKIDKLELLDDFVKEVQQYRFTNEEIEMWNVKNFANENGLTGSYKEKLKVYKNPELAEELIEKQRKRKEHLDATKEERNKKAQLREIEKWYNYETRNIKIIGGGRRYWHGRGLVATCLRLKENDNQMVETSQNAVVPLIEAKLLYHKFKQCRDSNTSWKQNGERFRIGYYHVDRIYKNGDKWYLLAGCHNICEDQIEEFVDKFVPEWKK